MNGFLGLHEEPNSSPQQRRSSSTTFYAGDTSHPEFWGPACWKFLHVIAAKYDPQARESVRALMNALPDTFPCEECSNHLTRYLEQHGPELDFALLQGKVEFSRWVLDLHNYVSARLHKPQWTFEMLNAQYRITEPPKPTFNEQLRNLKIGSTRCRNCGDRGVRR